jgi:hypothetical protein
MSSSKVEPTKSIDKIEYVYCFDCGHEMLCIARLNGAPVYDFECDYCDNSVQIRIKLPLK